MVFLDLYFAISHMYNSICIHRKKKVTEIHDRVYGVIEEAIRQLSDEYGVHCLDPESVTRKVIEYYYFYKCFRGFVIRFIRKLNPKVVLVVQSYAESNMVFIECSKKMNVPTVELQHGVVWTEHPAYNYPSNCDILQFPDYYFSFADYWTNNACFPIGIERRIPVGWPFFERMKKGLSRENPNGIVFVSNGLNTKEDIRMATIVSKEIANGRVMVRIHPAEKKETYKELESPLIEIVDNNDYNLYDLLNSVEHAVFINNSSSIFEALEIKVKCYVFLPNARADCKMLCKEGFAMGFSSVSELMDLIVSSPEIAECDETFFESDSLYKITNTLGRIIKG